MRYGIAATLVALALACAPNLVLAQASQAPQSGLQPKISVQTTPIGDIIKNPQARAILEKEVPEIARYYDQIASMSLAEVEPMSQGRIDDDKLKRLQAEFDQLDESGSVGPKSQ